MMETKVLLTVSSYVFKKSATIILIEALSLFSIFILPAVLV